MKPGSVEEYVRDRGWQHRVDGKWLRLQKCPLPTCGSTSRNPFVLNVETGAGTCHVCGWVGGLFLLQVALGDVTSRPTYTPSSGSTSPAPGLAKEWAVPTQVQVDDWHRSLVENDRLLSRYCEARSLELATVKAAKLGWDVAQRALVLPYFERGRCVAVKFKQPQAGGGKKIWRMAGCRATLYGVDDLVGTQRVIVCEGEEDALVLRQAGLGNVVSVPDGCKGLGPWLDALEPFREVIVAFDADEPGREGAQRLAAKLGLERCRLVAWPDVPGCKDPTDFARAGRLADACDAIDRAEGHDPGTIVHVSAYLDELEAEFCGPGGRQRGDPTGYRELDALTGGDRGGDLVLVSGFTGHGKSAFVRGLALRRAAAGIPVGFGTFEETQRKFSRRAVQALSGRYFSLRDDGSGSAMSLAEFRAARAALERMPLYFFRHFGQWNIEEYLDAMRYARRRYDVRTFVLDHLHFMLQSSKRTDDERLMLDHALMALKQTLVKLEDVRCYVVAHLSKPEGRGADPLPTKRDLRGSSFLQQVPDSIVFVWRDEAGEQLGSVGSAQFGVSTVLVAKNRDDGMLGKFTLPFHRASQILFDAEDEARPGGFVASASVTLGRSSQSEEVAEELAMF